MTELRIVHGAYSLEKQRLEKRKSKPRGKKR